MEPIWESLFYAAAILLWLIGAVKPKGVGRLTPMTCALLGWACFAFPFLWEAVAAIEK